ncbi:MAG: hypothetical protein R3300_11985 [Candidatus Promineifilaceae bacterium]|nr:hypothetical protein [Candidatus Promineifilaceae bacterium]
MTETTVNSFVVRFVQEAALPPEQDPAAWRGVIRHVQSKTELHFTNFHDAVTFMSRFLEFKEEQQSQP